MKDNDYKMLEEAYTKIKEARSFGMEPWHNEEQWDHDKEWHGLGAKAPKDIDPRDLMNPDYSKEKPNMEDDGDELTDELLNTLNRYEEQQGEGQPNVEDLAIAVAKVIKELYGSHNKQPFVDHFTGQFTDK